MEGRILLVGRRKNRHSQSRQPDPGAQVKVQQSPNKKEKTRIKKKRSNGKKHGTKDEDCWGVTKLILVVAGCLQWTKKVTK